MKRGKVHITPGFLLLMAWLYYSGQERIVGLTLVSSAVHEFAHYIPLRLSGMRIERLCITAAGAEMAVSGHMSYLTEVAAAAAGPVSNLLIAFVSVRAFGERGYMLAGINLALAVFNLLPVPGLDGGRCLAGLAGWMLGPRRSDVLCRAVGGAVSAAAAAAGAAAFFLAGNVTGLLAGAWLCGTCICKSWRTDGKKGLSFPAGTGKMVRV